MATTFIKTGNLPRTRVPGAGEATDVLNEQTDYPVTVNYTAGVTAALPYTAGFAAAGAISDVAQVADGRWFLTGSGVRTDSSATGYDRLIALGDWTWQTNYEVTLPVTVHAGALGGTFGAGMLIGCGVGVAVGVRVAVTVTVVEGSSVPEIAATFVAAGARILQPGLGLVERFLVYLLQAVERPERVAHVHERLDGGVHTGRDGVALEVAVAEGAQEAAVGGRRPLRDLLGDGGEVLAGSHSFLGRFDLGARRRGLHRVGPRGDEDVCQAHRLGSLEEFRRQRVALRVPGVAQLLGLGGNLLEVGRDIGILVAHRPREPAQHDLLEDLVGPDVLAVAHRRVEHAALAVVAHEDFKLHSLFTCRDSLSDGLLFRLIEARFVE